MRIMSDNDVIGAVEAMRHVLESPAWAEFSKHLGVEFLQFDDLDLLAYASDREVWQQCQAANTLLITGNRASGIDSLDVTIRELGDDSSLPVVTIADAKELLHNRLVAEAAAAQLLTIVEQIESLRGSGRLYIP